MDNLLSYFGLVDARISTSGKNLPIWSGILNFKFRIVFWNIFFGRFEKRIAFSEKKTPLGLS